MCAECEAWVRERRDPFWKPFKAPRVKNDGTWARWGFRQSIWHNQSPNARRIS